MFVVIDVQGMFLEKRKLPIWANKVPNRWYNSAAGTLRLFFKAFRSIIEVSLVRL